MRSPLSFTALAAACSLVAAVPAKYVSVTRISGRTLTSASDLHARGVNFNWGTDKVRGVNLGGWLVLES
jgi:hypothetical protein